MSAKYKEHLEEKFLYTLIPNICKNSDALEEAQGKAKELRKKEIKEQSLKDCQFFITEDNLEIYVEETWNEVWGKFNEQ